MNWYKNIWRPRTLGIIFIRFSGNETTFSAVKIGRKKLVCSSFDSFQNAIDSTGKNIPYHIHVYGSGILSRKVEFLPTFKNKLIISGNQDDFIFTSFNDESEVATSFFRKELIAEELNYCTDNKLHLLGISSGTVPAFNILNDAEISLDYTMAIENGKITSFERNLNVGQLVHWNDEEYSHEELLAKSIYQNYQTNSENYEHESNDLAIENFSQFSQFKAYGIGVLLIILLSLTGNYFYQNKLNNDIAQLELDLSLSNDNLSLLNRLEQEKERKEQLIGSAGITSSKFLAFYLDEIGRTVPKSIQLQEMKLFPLSKKLKNKQKVDVDQDQITIIGTTKNNVVLDNWIEKMDRFEWVKSIELLNYLKNERNQAEFKLLININT